MWKNNNESSIAITKNGLPRNGKFYAFEFVRLWVLDLYDFRRICGKRWFRIKFWLSIKLQCLVTQIRYLSFGSWWKFIFSLKTALMLLALSTCVRRNIEGIYSQRVFQREIWGSYGSFKIYPEAQSHSQFPYKAIAAIKSRFVCVCKKKKNQPLYDTL